jgi:hypothetical protein
MLGPVPEGERIRLEPPIRDHLATVATWRGDLEATRYLLILQFPPSPKQHEEWLEKTAASPGPHHMGDPRPKPWLSSRQGHWPETVQAEPAR